MAQKPSLPKGTRDFGTEEMSRREFIFETLKNVFRKYGYLPIETPSMENLSVLTGKYGEEGDRLIFKILNSGDYLKKAKGIDIEAEGAAREMLPRISEKALRYDLTVPFARYVAMNHQELPLPFKRYQIQPVWRADRPQKGRYREFVQCDCDMIGSDSLFADAEMLGIFDDAFTALGFPEVRVLFNNRKILAGIAEVAGIPDKMGEMCVAIDKLDKIGEEKVREELERRGVEAVGRDKIFEILGFAGSNDERIAQLKAAFADSEIGMQGTNEVEEVLSYLPHFKPQTATVELDIKLARGLEYYTGSIYEVKAVGIEYGSICGGGRYDDLTGIFGVPNLPGVGISFGSDRIYDVMMLQGYFKDVNLPGIQAVLINFGEQAFIESIKFLNELREAGIACELYPEPAKLKKQFRFADKRNAKYTLAIGTEEVENNTVAVKNLKTGEQSTLPRVEAIQLLQTH